LDRKRLLKYISDARVSVHLLGATGDSSLRVQIDLALEAGRKTVFYLTRGHEVATGDQKALIDDIRANKWSLAAGTWALLDSRSAAVQRQDLIDLLRPPKPATARAQNGAARVYLLCDPSSEDSSFAREVQERIREKEKFDVALPQPPADSSSPAAEHERLLRWCDGLLLYHERAPVTWYRFNFKDLVTAEDRKRERELKSKALLVGGSNMEIPGLTVIQRREPILEQLEPFLAPLRTGQGDAAHAG
jgi:hypothetical protein